MSHEHSHEPAPETLPTRRDFLRCAGFTLAGVALSGCARERDDRALPYPVAPPETTPGRRAYYASVCRACPAGCGAIVATRDGRPIKMEGNPDHPLSRGGLCAVGQASLLELYDSHRLRRPMLAGQPSDWPSVDRAVTAKLATLRDQPIRLLTGTITSPTAQRQIRAFLSGFPEARWVCYDSLSTAAIPAAHQVTHGLAALPRYRFDRAAVIVGIEADFLGAWISPVEYTASYRAGRNLAEPSHDRSYHVQFEAGFSLTGGQADRRLPVAPSEMIGLVGGLTARIARLAHYPYAASASVPERLETFLDALAERLWAARGRALVVCGLQDLDVQVSINLLNHLLDAYEHTLSLREASAQQQGDDKALTELLAELREGRVGALLVAGNPVYDLPDGETLGAAIEKTPLSVAFADLLDETASRAQIVCPTGHELETWGDAEPVNGIVSLAQPTIRPLGDTRALFASLAAWRGAPASEHELVRECWRNEIHPRQSEEPDFDRYWDHVLQAGWARVAPRPEPGGAFVGAPVAPLAETAADGFELLTYGGVALRDGRHAENPWLQELPDPITKVAWDNVAILSPAAAASLGVELGDGVALATADGRSVELPVVTVPGLPDRVVAVALGYGRAGTARFAELGPDWIERRPCVGENGLVGVNVAPLRELRDGLLRHHRAVSLRATGRRYRLARSQEYDRLTLPVGLAPPGVQERPVVERTTLEAYRRDPAAGAHEHHDFGDQDLWPPDHRYTGHHWAMVIDLDACTGCAACVIACQAENNIPVVGKDEVARRRDMHWLRIDRYFTDVDGEVSIAHQPLLCHQCDNAPCEVVCPVLATVHSDEGLNQQVYNRCVGTRYCANNCPYKVRRFNWFEYPHDDATANLVLNPDVTVRSRGVMEKCTFCVQRIEAARAEARRRGVTLADGDVATACQQSCPAQAITFGDRNDPNSAVAARMRDPRGYQLLAELNLLPSVGYLRIVRDRPASEEQHG